MSATRTISTKLKIEGESEYKSALSNINTELGNMKSRLSETSSEYQSSQNSIEALRAKTEALSNVQQTQTEKVNVLREAYNTASSTLTDYQNKGTQLSSSIQDNQTKLSSMSTEVQQAGQQWAEYSNKITENEERLRELESSTGDTSEEEAQLREEIAQCQSAMSQLETETDGAAKEAGELILQDQQLNSELEQNNQKTQQAENACNNWERQLNNAQTQLNNTDAELKETNQYLEEAEKSSDGCATSIDQFGNKMTSSAKSADTLSSAIGAAGLTAATKKLIDAMESCIKTAAAFESQMSTVKALSGATSEDMELLTAAAKEMGATTSFTATESAEALEYMALAGWDTEEMLDGLPGIINLAAAAGEDLGSTCDIVTDALTAFGLGAEDSAHFADVLASTATNSNTTVSQMGEAFKQVATTAGTLGYSIDDVSVALGLMADNGLKGSSAGTALSTALTRMSGANSSATKELDELNVSMFNADGTTKDLAQFLGELRTSLNENCTSTQDMQVALYNLAGQKGMKGLAAIVNTTDEDFAALTDSIANCEGSAEEMADIRLDNFEGQVTLLKSAWDALVTTLGEAALGALTNVVGLLTDVVSATGDFLAEHQMLAAAIDAFVVALAAMGAALAVAAVAVSKLGKAFKELAATMAETGIGAIVMAVAGLTAGLTTFIAICASTETEQKKLTQDMKDLTKEVKEQKAAFEDEQEETQKAADNYSSMVDELEDLLNQSDRSASAEERLKSIIEQLNEILGEGTIVYDDETGAINENIDAVRALVDAHNDEEAYNDLLERQTQLYDDRAEAEKALEEAREENCTVLDRLQAGEEMTGMEIAGYSTAAAQASLVTGTYSDAITEAEKALDEIDTELDDINAQIDAYNVTTEEAADTTDGEIVAAAEDLAERLIALQDAYTDAYDAAYESISGQFELWEQLDEVTTTSFDDAMAAMETQREYWKDYADNVEDLLNRNIDGLDELVLAYCDGSMESAGYIASMHEMTNDELEAMILEEQRVSQQQYRLADETADAMTGMSGEVDKAIQDCIEIIWGLDQSDEAYQSAYDTLANYVGGLTDEEGEVTGEAEYIEQAILDQFMNEANAKQAEEAGSNTGKSLASGIESQLANVNTVSAKIATGSLDTIEGVCNENALIDAGVEFVQGAENGMESESPNLDATTLGVGNSAITSAQSILNNNTLVPAGEDTIQGAITGEESKRGALNSSMQTTGVGGANAFKGGMPKSAGNTIGADFIQGAVDGEDSKRGALTSKSSSSGAAAVRELQNSMPYSSGNYAGSNLIQGGIDGINAKAGALASAAGSAASAASSKFQSTLQVASPSKLSRWILENYMEGGIIGIEDKEADLSDSMAEAAKRASASFSENMAVDTEELNASATMAYSASVNTTSTGMEKIALAMENLSKLDLSVLEYLPYLKDIAENEPDIYLNGKSIVEYVKKQISNDQHTLGRAAGIV